MVRESVTTNLERLKASILSEARAYGPVAKLVLMPDSANRRPSSRAMGIRPISIVQ